MQGERTRGRAEDKMARRSDSIRRLHMAQYVIGSSGDQPGRGSSNESQKALHLDLDSVKLYLENNLTTYIYRKMTRDRNWKRSTR